MSKSVTFFELAERLDELIALEGPTSEQVDDVLQLISDQALERYFFKHLANSENAGWFEPLRQHSVFDASPEPVARDGKIHYPTWFAFWYLAAIASQLPLQVIQIAQSVRTQDPFVMSEFVHAAVRMPPQYAAQIVPTVVQWVEQGLRIGESVLSLTVYLAQQSMWEDALELVDLIFSPQAVEVSEERRANPFYFPEATARADRYHLDTFMDSELALFLDYRPIEMLTIIEENLEKAMDIEQHDTSSIWRPAIEPHEQNLGFGDIKEQLVKAQVKTLGTVIEKAPSQARPIVERYLEHRYPVFRRLAVHMVRTYASLWPDLLERLFTDYRYLNESEVHHEYWMLIHHAFATLPQSVQNAFVDQIISQLPPKQDEYTMEGHFKRLAVLRWFWAIKDFLSDDEHLMLLDELVSEYGEPDHPDFLSYSTSRWGSISPKSAQDLSQMTPDDILAELKKKLPFDSFDGPTLEGLANALRFAITSTPEHFVPIAPDLFHPEIPPFCTAEALRGFRSARQEGKTFDWVPVLQLCTSVVQEPIESEGVDAETPLDMQPGYSLTTYAGARSAVAELLQVGIARDDHPIGSELLPQVRDMLLTLADDPNPSPEHEHNLLTEYSYDVLTIALNVTRGKAIEALIRYALHLARINKEQEAAGDVEVGDSRLETQVKDRLTEKLDKQIDPSLAVHSLFGKYLPNLHYLDKAWLLTHLEDIFPRQPEQSDYWEAAWDSYMFRGDFFEHLYERLKPYYRYAIEQMALGAQGKAGSELSRRRLAHHLAILYWRGIEPLEGKDSLIPPFFDAASDGVRAVFISSLGGGLRETKPGADSETWIRAKALWLTRFHEITDVVSSQVRAWVDFREELGTFSQWVPFIPESLEPFYLMIESSGLAADRRDLGDLFKFLVTVVQEHTHFVVSFLERIVRRESSVWFWGPRDVDIVWTILEAVMTSDNEGAKDCATRIINLFGERGNERYRGLLKLG